MGTFPCTNGDFSMYEWGLFLVRMGAFPCTNGDFSIYEWWSFLVRKVVFSGAYSGLSWYERVLSMKRRSLPRDYALTSQSMSMQNRSAIHFAIFGGSTRMSGVIPICASSFWYGLHQLTNVLTDTPAYAASCVLVIAFI